MTEHQTQTEAHQISDLIGPGQAAIGALLSKEIKMDEACAFVAHSIPDSFHEFIPKPYPQPSATLVDYIGSRYQGLVKREGTLAIANAVWLQAVWQIFLSNQHDVEFLEWAAKICEEKGSIDAATKIKEHAAQFQLNIFPETLYKEGRRVQRMDIEERMKGDTEKRR